MKTEKLPYYSYGSYLAARYGKKAYRVGVDAGFSCPNRGCDRTNPGCTYCDEHGARATYLDEEPFLKEQVDRGITFLKKRYRAEVFLLYLQAFSNTFGTVDHLRSVYDYCLSLADFQELIISTRPDCINRSIVELLRSYKGKNLDVWVELGLQSANDRSLERINRGHGVADFFEAFDLLKKGGIKISVHLIFGLPGETWEDMERTVRTVGRLHPDAVKIHNLHIPFETGLYREYLAGELNVPGDLRHLEYLIRALELLPGDIIIQRITTDTPKQRRAAPKSFLGKSGFYDILEKSMNQRETWQGRQFSLWPI